MIARCVVRLLQDEGEEYEALLERFRSLSSHPESKVLALCFSQRMSNNSFAGRRECAARETLPGECLHSLPSRHVPEFTIGIQWVLFHSYHVKLTMRSDHIADGYGQREDDDILCWWSRGLGNLEQRGKAVLVRPGCDFSTRKCLRCARRCYFTGTHPCLPSIPGCVVR